MSHQVHQAALPLWELVLGLSERLMNETEVSAQYELILETVVQITGGDVDLWFSQRYLRPFAPDAAESLLSPPLSDLMRRALDARKMCCDAEGPRAAAPAVAVPLIARENIIGVLQVRRPGGPLFQEAELKLLASLAAQSAIVLHATHQEAVEQWQSEQLALVSKVSAQVANVLDLQELSRRVTDLILRTFTYYYVALFVLEAESPVLRCKASAGPDRDGAEPGELLTNLEIHLGEGIIGHVAQTGEEILANNVSEEPRYRHLDSLPETRSEVALPLKIEGRVLGVLDVQSDRSEDFHEVDLLVLRSLAENISIALEHAQLYSDLHRRAEQITILSEVSRAVTSFIDLEALLDEVAALIQRRFGYPFVHLLTVDLTRGQVIYRAGTVTYDTASETARPSLGLEAPDDIMSWVVLHGETALVDPVSGDPRCPSTTLRSQSVQSELAVPLVFGSRVLGVLDVQSDRRHAFDSDDRALFEALADSIAIGVRNANLYRAERWRRQVADSMRGVASMLSADVVVEDVLSAILQELERALPCDLAAICLLEEEDLYVAASRGEEASPQVSAFRSDANLWLAHALSADQPIIRSADSPIDPLAAAKGFPADYSAIAAPLRTGLRQLGLLILADRDARRYGAESRVIMAAFASYASVAIENARMYQASQEQALIAEIMLQVAEATQSLATLNDVLETVVRLVPMLVGADRCAILLRDQVAGAFLPAAAYGLNASQQDTFFLWRIDREDSAAFGEMSLSKSPIVCYELGSDPDPLYSAVSALGFSSLLALPLLAQGEMLGAMLADLQAGQPGSRMLETRYGERLAVLQGIAHQAAAAVENAVLREAQQEEAYVSTALLQVAQTVATLSDLDDILAAIVRITPILVGVERCVLFLWEDEQACFRASHTYGISRDAELGLFSQRYSSGDFGILDAVRERGSLVVHPYEVRSDVLSGTEQFMPTDFAVLIGAVADRATSRTLMGFPLSIKGDILGVMVLDEAEDYQGSRERRLEIITGIAQQAALALQHEQLQQERLVRERLERELQLAHEIQKTFIPDQLPSLPGWELAAVWRAARQVAGDFYDLLDLPDGRMGLLVADVADKGMPAALFMVLTRTLIRAAALENASPSAVLARVNDLLVPDAQHGMFVTAFYAVLSLDTGALTYANAGHNCPLLLRSGARTVEELSKGGMALGVLEGERMKEHSAVLEPGDCVVFYTDGVTEAYSPEQGLYGDDQFRLVIEASAGRSAQAVLEAIDRSVLAHMGSAPPSDDLTLMVLRREAIADPPQPTATGQRKVGTGSETHSVSGSGKA